MKKRQLSAREFLNTSETEVKFSQEKSSPLVMMSVIVLACGFSTISERRQQERLVLASQEQGKHCV